MEIHQLLSCKYHAYQNGYYCRNPTKGGKRRNLYLGQRVVAHHSRKYRRAYAQHRKPEKIFEVEVWIKIVKDISLYNMTHYVDRIEAHSPQHRGNEGYLKRGKMRRGFSGENAEERAHRQGENKKQYSEEARFAPLGRRTNGNISRTRHSQGQKYTLQEAWVLSEENKFSHTVENRSKRK